MLLLNKIYQQVFFFLLLNRYYFVFRKNLYNVFNKNYIIFLYKNKYILHSKYIFTILS